MTSNAATVALSSAAIREVLSKDKFTKLAMDPDPEGRFLLHDEYKEIRPNEFFIGELLKYQPDRISRINGSGEVPLHCACRNMDNIEVSLLALLLEAYPDGARVPNNKGYLPLHKAVSIASAVPGGDDLFSLKQRKNMKSLGLILEAFPEALSQQNMEGQLPLHVAVSRPPSISLSVVQLLCQYYPEGARVSDDYGHLPLHKSVQVARKEKANPQVVEVLLELFPKGAVYQDYRGYVIHM